MRQKVVFSLTHKFLCALCSVLCVAHSDIFVRVLVLSLSVSLSVRGTNILDLLSSFSQQKVNASVAAKNRQKGIPTLAQSFEMQSAFGFALLCRLFSPCLVTDALSCNASMHELLHLLLQYVSPPSCQDLQFAIQPFLLCCCTKGRPTNSKAATAVLLFFFVIVILGHTKPVR